MRAADLVISAQAADLVDLHRQVGDAEILRVLADRRCAFFREWASLVLAHNHALQRQNARLRERLRAREHAELTRRVVAAERVIREWVRGTVPAERAA